MLFETYKFNQEKKAALTTRYGEKHIVNDASFHSQGCGFLCGY